jgi:hypothetical protein
VSRLTSFLRHAVGAKNGAAETAVIPLEPPLDLAVNASIMDGHLKMQREAVERKTRTIIATAERAIARITRSRRAV